MTVLPSSQVDIEINVRTVRHTLNQWDYPAKLGQTALASMKSVSNRLIVSSQADTIINRGLALKEQLNLAIQALRPDEAEPQPLKREWRAFLVITERYCYGRLPEWIMVHLSISSRTFYRELNLGLGEIVAILQQIESKTGRPSQPSETAADTPQKAQRLLFSPPVLPNHPIVGRGQMVQQIAHQLINEQKPIIALHGLPGIGKSTVALATAQLASVAERFKDGIIWMGVGPNPNLHTLLIRLAERVGTLTDSLKTLENEEIAEVIRNHISARKLLIVLDDIWQAEVAHHLCVGGPESAHLITMRQPEIALSLAGPSVIPIDELSDQHSQQIIKALAPDISSQSEIDLTQLYEHTGGLPLALVIFGKYLQKHGYRGQLTRLKEALKHLTEKQTRLTLELSESPIGPKANRADARVNLSAVIRLSTDALSPAMMRALKNLTFFAAKPNSFNQEAAMCLCSGKADILYRLVDSGLLEMVETDRYGLHPLIHDYVSLENQTPFESAGIQDELLKWCEKICAVNRQNFQPLDLEAHNIEAVLLHGLNTQATEAVSNILYNYTNYLIDRGRVKHAAEWVEQGVNLAQADEDQRGEVYLLYALGMIAKQREGAERAIYYLEKGQSLATELNLEAAEFRTKIELIQIYIHNGQPKKAYHMAESIRSKADNDETHTEPHIKAQVYVAISYVYYFQGNYQYAFDLVSRARQLLEESDSQPEVSQMASIYQKLGVLSIDLARFSTAAVYYDLAYDRFCLLNNQGQAAHLLNNMGVLASKKGQWMRAINLHKQALELRISIDDTAGQGQSFLNLAVVAVAQKDINRAQKYIENGMKLTEASGMRYRQSLFKLMAASISRVQGYFDHALAHANEAFSLAQELDRDQTAGEAAMEQGYALIQLNQLNAAADKLTFAHKLWENSEQEHLLAATNIYLAHVANLQQDSKTARAYLSAGLTYLERGVDGLDDTMDILQICVSTLEALGDEENAARYKQKALSYLKQQSLQIEDPAVRLFFKTSINL